MNDNPLYICYSLPLMIYLLDNGMRYHAEGKHKITGKDFWVFVKSDELNNLLHKWSNKAN